MSFDKVVEFMDKAVGDGDILKLTRSYTKDVNGVLTLLYDVYPIIHKKSIKNRCKKVQRKIKKAMAKEKNADDLVPDLSALQDESVGIDK